MLLECHDSGNRLIMSIDPCHRPLYLYDNKCSPLWLSVQDILDSFHCKPVQKYNPIHLNKLYLTQGRSKCHQYNMAPLMANIRIFCLFGDHFYVYIVLTFAHDQLDNNICHQERHNLLWNHSHIPLHRHRLSDFHKLEHLMRQNIFSFFEELV